MNQEKFKILVVDDNEINRKLLARVLHKKGYAVEEAENGLVALDKVANWKPDLVLLDIIMPELDGLEVLKILRTKLTQAELPIILVTAMQGSDDVVKGFRLGANDYLPKNFNTEELFARVNTALQIREFHKLLKQRNNIIERELDIARLIQKKLLPLTAPILPGYNVGSLYVPMDKIGGDYYDYDMSAEHCDFFLADVSGHGVPGAFIASILKMSTEHLEEQKLKIPDILGIMDKAVSDRGAMGMFATALIMRLFPKAGKIFYSNAGHHPILIQRRKTDEFLELTTPGAPLGVNYDFKKLAYLQGEFQLEIGDRILLYTDGIIETVNENGDPFETNGWIDFLTQQKGNSIESLSTNLITTLRQYSKKNTFEDDITWVIVDYVGN